MAGEGSRMDPGNYNNSFHDDKTSRAVYAAAWVIGIAASLAVIWFVEAMW